MVRALESLLELSPLVQVLFDVREGGELVGTVATRAARESGLMLSGDVQGRPLDEVLRPECCDSLKAGLRDALRLGQAVSYEEIVVIDDRERWWMTTVSPELDEDEVPCRVLVTFLALDFMQKTESLLRRSEANFRALIEGIPDATFVADAAGQLLYANPAAVRWFGLDPVELHGLVVADVVTPAQRANPVELVRLPVVFDAQSATLIVARKIGNREGA